MTNVVFISVGLETEAKNLRRPIYSTFLKFETLGNITFRTEGRADVDVSGIGIEKSKTKEQKLYHRNNIPRKISIYK
jgi:hypothetical protein